MSSCAVQEETLGSGSGTSGHTRVLSTAPKRLGAEKGLLGKQIAEAVQQLHRTIWKSKICIRSNGELADLSSMSNYIRENPGVGGVGFPFMVNSLLNLRPIIITKLKYGPAVYVIEEEPHKCLFVSPLRPRYNT